MKLNQDSVWTISKTQLKFLSAVEHLSKHHEIVPINSIKKLLKLNCNSNQILIDLCKSNFLHYEAIPYLGYRLSISGYDCLAINTLRNKGLNILGDKIGIGKESDIYYGEYAGKRVAVKFHRLGRTSFRTIKNNRDYHGKKKFLSWLQLSKISAEKEFEYMNMFCKLIDIPQPIDANRHVVVMEYLEDYSPLYCVKDCDVDKVYKQMITFIEDFYKLGYVHGDFNEFNVMINNDNKIKIIDFPQCVALDSPRAKEYLIRDVEGVKTYFNKKYRYINDYEPVFQ